MLGGCPCRRTIHFYRLITTFNYFLGWVLLSALNYDLEEGPIYVNFFKGYYPDVTREKNTHGKDNGDNKVYVGRTAVIIFAHKYHYIPKKEKKILVDKKKLPKPEVEIPYVQPYKKPEFKVVETMHDMPRPVNSFRYIEYYNFNKQAILETTHFGKRKMTTECQPTSKEGIVIDKVSTVLDRIVGWFKDFTKNLWLTEHGARFRILKMQPEQEIEWDTRLQTGKWSFYNEGTRFNLEHAPRPHAISRLVTDDGFIRFFRRDMWIYARYNSSSHGKYLFDTTTLKDWKYKIQIPGVWRPVKALRFKAKREAWDAGSVRNESFRPVEVPYGDHGSWNYIYRNETSPIMSRVEIIKKFRTMETNKYTTDKIVNKLFLKYEEVYFSDYNFFHHKFYEYYVYSFSNAIKRQFTSMHYLDFAYPTGHVKRYHFGPFYYRATGMWDSYSSDLIDILPTLVLAFCFFWVLFIEWPRFLEKFIIRNNISSGKTFRLNGSIHRKFPAKVSTKLLLALNRIPNQYVLQNEEGKRGIKIILWNVWIRNFNMLKRLFNGIYSNSRTSF